MPLSSKTLVNKPSTKAPKCGEAIDKSFLTSNRIASIINSRLDTIKLLKQKYQNDFPKIFIQASATGIYKDSNEELTENGSFNNNFYAKLVTQIETHADQTSGLRTEVLL